ncbi:MAG: UPF0147 family protein [Nanoarchaeota archaeon]|nr:UPF0147 family protein [Nanoarchaeota archaeon]
MEITQIFEVLTQIHEDDTIPRNIRAKIKNTAILLQQNGTQTNTLHVDKIIQELDELGNDSNMPMYTRTQIWEIISSLESVK